MPDNLLSPEEIAEIYGSLPPDKARAASTYIQGLLTEQPAPMDRLPGYADRQSRQISGYVSKSLIGLDAFQTSKRTHRVTGRLVFEIDLLTHREKPLHNMEIELWLKRRIMRDRFLGQSRTGKDGSFEIWYEPAQVSESDLGHLELRIFEQHHIYDDDGELGTSFKLIHTITEGSAVTDDTFDFGKQAVPYWEYDLVTISPRAMVLWNGPPPEEYSSGRRIYIAKKMAWLGIKRQIMIRQNERDPNTPSLEEIQKGVPENLTRRLERESPGYTRSDEYFGERVLNGMFASIIDKDRNNPDWYRLYHHWNAYEQDGIHILPNVDIRFEMRDEKLFPVQITLQIRRPGVTEPHAPTHLFETFTPADGEKWMQAKRLARMSATLSAELDFHLGQTHYNVEQYAVPAFRNLRRNPLRYLLFPHMKEVSLVNRSAEDLLLEENGFIPQATALTDLSIAKRVKEIMGTLDWKNWQPRRAISKNHTYALGAQLFWDILTDYVEFFFDQHFEGILHYWYEVHRLSEELINHSVPFQPTPMGNLDWYWHERDDDEARASERDMGDWFDPNERMDLSIPRHVVNDVPIAVQPITQSDKATPEDMENMKQVCRYIIMHATFMHTWSNSRQWDDGGEILYNSLGLRYGKNSIMGSEDDLSVAPTPKNVIQGLSIAYYLTYGAYGFIMKNEDRDIHPYLIEALGKKREEFANLGIDIDTIQSRTNV